MSADREDGVYYLDPVQSLRSLPWSAIAMNVAYTAMRLDKSVRCTGHGTC